MWSNKKPLNNGLKRHVFFIEIYILFREIDRNVCNFYRKIRELCNKMDTFQPNSVSYNDVRH